MKKNRLTLRSLLWGFLVAPVLLMLAFQLHQSFSMPEKMADQFGRHAHTQMVNDFAKSIEFEMRITDVVQLEKRANVWLETPDAVEMVIRDIDQKILVSKRNSGSPIAHSVSVPVLSGDESKNGPRVIGFIEVQWSNESAENIAGKQVTRSLIISVIILMLMSFIALAGWRLISGWFVGVVKALQQITLGREMETLDSHGVVEIDEVNRQLSFASKAIEEQRTALVEYAAAHRRLLHGLAKETLEHIRLSRELMALIDEPTFAGRARLEVNKLTSHIEQLSEQVRCLADDAKQPGTVLYVGAQDLAANDTGSVLRHFGFTWLTAQSSTEVIRLLEQNAIDVVILDHADSSLPASIRSVEQKTMRSRSALIITTRVEVEADGYLEGLTAHRVAAALRAAEQASALAGRHHALAADHVSDSDLDKGP